MSQETFDENLRDDGETFFHVPSKDGLVVNGHNKHVRLDGKPGHRYDYGKCVCCGGWDNDWAILCETCYEEAIPNCRYHKNSPEEN